MSAIIRVPSVQLKTVPAADADAPVWVQVARVGSFAGYSGGSQPFEFTPATFDTIVANFHANPSYIVGPKGVGNADVIAWDFGHASEMPATAFAVTGTPAQGWIQELQSRRGADGVVALWALTRWLEPARTYIRNGAYKWASVSVVLDAVDPVTAKRVGPMLTSVALTNQPFIEGMQALAASRFGTSTQQSKGPNMNTDTKAAIINRARQLRSTTPTVAMALSKAAAEVCPGLTHDERWTQYVHPLLGQHSLEVVRHAVSQGAQLTRASRQESPGAGQTSGNGKPVLDVSIQFGPTPFAKLLSHVKGMSPHLSHEAATEHAMRLSRSHNVVA